MTSRWIAGVCVSLAAVATLAGAARADEVKVGLISTFSGGYARWGQQFSQAIQVYQKQHGDSVDGNKITFIDRDDTGPVPDKAKQLAQDLILRDKVDFLAGFPWSPNALAVADIITQAKKVTIDMNAATAVITRKSPYFVRTSDTLPQVSKPEAEWAAKNGIKTVVTAVADYAPGIDAESEFVPVFQQSGGKVIESIRIPLSTTDFSPFFERVLADKPDALFIFGPGGPGSVGMIKTWATRLKPAGIKLLATTEIQQLDLPSFGDAAIGVVSASYYTETDPNPLNVALKKDLAAMFPGAQPDIASISAYDGTEIIYRVVKALGPHPDPDKAMAMIKGMTFPSPRGTVLIDPVERDIVQNIYMRRVEKQADGTLVNTDFATIPMVKDPWKEDHPAS